MLLRRTILNISIILSINISTAFAVTIDTVTNSPQSLGSENLNINSGGSIEISGSNHAVSFSNWGTSININADTGQGIISDTGYAIIDHSTGHAGVTINLNSGLISSNQNALLFSIPVSSFYESYINTSANTSIIAQETAITNLGDSNYIYPGTYEQHSLTITNAGTISGTTAISSSDSELIVVNSGSIDGAISTTEGRITNSGTITGNISATTGDLEITNTGHIIGNIDLGLASDRYHTTDHLLLPTVSYLTLNDGSITGDVTIRNNVQIIQLNGGTFSGTINSSSANLGTVNVNSNQTVSFSNNGIDTLNITDGNTLTLGSSNLNTNNIALAGTLGLGSSNKAISGTITTTGSSNLDLGSGSHTIDSNLSLLAGDTLSVTLASSGDVGNLTSAGTITIANGVKIDASVGNTYSYINDGAEFKIISGQDASSINAVSDSNINVNESGTNQAFSLLTFTSSTKDNGLYLNASRASAGTVTSNIVHQQVYNTVNEIGTDATGEMEEFQEYLDNATTQKQVDNALRSTLPQDSSGIQRNSINTVSNSVRTIENRLDAIRLSSLKSEKTPTTLATNYPTKQYKLSSSSQKAGVLAVLEPIDPPKYRVKSSGIASGDKEITQGIWGQTFGSASRQNSSNQNSGFKSRSGGLAFGYDKKISKDSRVGIAASYANSRVKSSDTLKRTDVDTYQVNLYHGEQFGKYFFDTIVGFAWNEYNSNRTITSGSTAQANYSGHSYISKFRGSMMNDLGSGFSLTPELLLNYVHNKSDDYAEAGAGTLNLEVQGTSTNFLEARAGLRLGYYTTTNKGTIITPEIRASYGYDFLGQRQTITSNFAGQTAVFSSLASKVDRNSLRIGAGIDVTNDNDVTFSLDYNFEKKSEYQSHYGFVKARYGF